MALIPNFDRIVATITASDIDKFLHSAAADDDKQRVRDASSNEIRMRLVGGYLIRTNQITPARLNGKLTKPKSSSKGTKAIKATKSPKSPTVSTVVEVSSVSVP
jgi:hypothetical protein